MSKDKLFKKMANLIKAKLIKECVSSVVSVSIGTVIVMLALGYTGLDSLAYGSLLVWMYSLTYNIVSIYTVEERYRKSQIKFYETLDDLKKGKEMKDD